jgi:hypothetical protein
MKHRLLHRLMPLQMAVLLLCSLFFSEQAFAQSNTSIIGIVRSKGNEALPGANVSVKNEATGFTTGTVANTEGRFVINQLPLGGPYTVTAQFIGYGAVQKTGYILRVGEQLRIDFELEEKASELQTVEVTASEDNMARVSPLGAATRLSVQEIKHMPTNGRSFQDLANLSPVVGSGATFAIGGQRESSTAITLDGGNQRYMMNGGLISSITVSMEAIREYEVTNNSYNVLEGRQGGGSVNVITKSGTNNLTGSAFYYIRNRNLTRDKNFLNQPISDFQIRQYGASLGGAIVKDKLHFFTAFDFEDRTDPPLAIIDVRDNATERLAQISRTNLDRLLTILQDQYGVDRNQQQTGLFPREATNRTVFARLDWQINDKHRLTFRNNVLWAYAPLTVGPSGVDPTMIYESYGNTRIWSYSGLAQLRSVLSSRLTNDLKVQYLAAQRNFEPNTRAPRGWVNVTSQIEGVGTVSRVFQFGGNRIAPEEQGERQVQLVNNLYWQKGKFFLTLGTDNIITFTNTLNTNEQGGLFEFPSLDALANRQPNRYTRLAPINPQDGFASFLKMTSADVALYAQADYNPTPKLNIQGGVRWDATLFMTRPERNPLLETTLGQRTNVIARDLNNIQPRLQITYDFAGDQTSVLKFGAGAYSANIVHWAQLSNMQQTGTRLTDVVATGANVPTPDFIRYRRDPNSVPGAELAGQSVPYINIIGNDFQAPTTWKGNLSFRQFFAGKVYVGINAYYGRTINNYVYVDRNLRNTPAFTLANEGNRPVYAPLDRVARANPARPGAIPYPISNPRDVNQDPRLGRVLELNGLSNVWQRGVILEAGVLLPKGGSINATYTYNQTEDNNSYNCCIARTSALTQIIGDPRNLNENRGNSGTDFRHKIVLFGTSPQMYGFRVGFRYVGIQGNPWTPIVFGDITGDGVGLLINTNKRAFIFDPAAIRANPAATPFERNLADGMEAVLNNPDNIAAELLRNNLGNFAPRNAVFNPMAHNLDVRLSYTLDKQTFKWLGSQNLEVIAECFNFLNFLKSDWGRNKIVPGGNQVLLQALGLDPLAEAQGRIQYAYNVNRAFGQATAFANLPYQIQIGVRYGF